MSHITHVRVDGLAGREGAVEFELNRDVNVFWGLNGCGKTSLMRIMHSAMRNDLSLIADVPFTSAEISIYSLNYDRVFKRKAKRKSGLGVTHPNPSRRSETEPGVRRLSDGTYIVSTADVDEDVWVTSPKSPKDAQNTFWRHRFLPTWRLYSNVNSWSPSPYGSTNQDGIDWDKLFAERLGQLWKTYSAELLGKVRQIQEDGFEDILRGVLSQSGKKGKHQDLEPDRAYQKVQSFFAHRGKKRVPESKATFISQFENDSQFRKVVREINRVEERIEIATGPRDKFEQLIRDMFSGTKELQFLDSELRLKLETGGFAPLSSLSSGEKHLLWIFIEALLIEESSLMIDEPEISLHVDWQRKILSSMRILNPEAQLIVASHSPEIMAEIPDDKIFSL